MRSTIGRSDGDWSVGNCPGSIPPPFYVSDATVSDATLIPGYVHKARAGERDVKSSSCLGSDTCLRDFFQAKGIELYRFIATDEALARTIRAELVLRHIDATKPAEQNMGDREVECGYHNVCEATDSTLDWISTPIEPEHSHIALISEWDTLYGRALPDTMARCLGTARMRATQR